MHLKIENPKNEVYQSALAKEMGLNTDGRRVVEFYPPYLEWHPKLNSYRNRLVLGSELDTPFEYYKIFKKYVSKSHKAFTIGAGSGIHQKEIEKLGLVENWVSLDLSKTEGDLLSSKSTKLIQGDLNFVELEENQFDLIFCAGVLHHIINLEHLLFQLNKSLKKNGILIVIEATTKNKWQWEERRLSYIAQQFRDRFGKKYQKIKFEKIPEWRINNYKTPFESIRSEDLPVLINKYFSENVLFELHWNRLIYPFLNTINKNMYPHELEMDRELMEFILELENNLDGTLKRKFSPSELIGIFQKNDRVQSPIKTNSWSQKKIKEELGMKKEPIKRRIIQFLKKIVNA